MMITLPWKTSESLDKIQILAEDKFQEITNKDRSRFSFPGQPCTSEHLQVLYSTGIDM